MHSITTSLHHVEVCVSDSNFVNLLVNGYGFVQWLERASNKCHQYVLRSKYCVFIVTIRHRESSSEKLNNRSTCIESGAYPTLFCCSDSTTHSNDAVFNVALEVPSVQKALQLVRNHGGTVVRDQETIEDQNGVLHFAVVTPPCKNLLHTLIEKVNYTGFLPGFNQVDISNRVVVPSTLPDHLMMDYIDHVTFVTEPGESSKLIQWYEDVFKMKRLFTNRDETPAEGFVLGEYIGLRLKALQYWRCAETGVRPPGEDSPDQLKLVIAEPLPEVEASHVQAFLKENGGPGVQHIAFHTASILDSVSIVTDAGVKFRKPPYTYYEEIIERKELKDAGMEKSLEKLEKLGVLIDFEDGKQSVNYLMQIFSYPVFKRDTFFLEIIQRNGASGFGAGNITALARSIIRYQQEKMKKSIENNT